MLDTIVAHKRREVEGRLTSSLDVMLSATAPATRSLRDAMRQPGRRFILEAKRRSPSRGDLNPDLTADDVVAAYGPVADAISVLTDHRFFGGDFDILRNVAQMSRVPVLCKDFVVDARQVVEARQHGADAILLMMSVLDDAEAAVCLDVCRRLNMDALVEVHSEVEMQRALMLNAELIGINNRDLRTLEVNLNVTRRLAPMAPADVVLVSESGIRCREDAKVLSPIVDGFLVGSCLTGADDLAAAARSLVFGDVKICGLTSEADARAAHQRGASYVGVIFAEKSKRRVDINVAKGISAAIPLPTVGVFTAVDVESIAHAVRAADLQVVQLHSACDDVVRGELRRRLPPHVDLWQAVGVDADAGTIDVMKLPSRAHVTRLLFDSAVRGQSGGTGVSFSHAVLQCIPDLHRHGLAGGLSPKNILEADAVGAALLDVNSGVEDAPGVKSHAKLSTLFDALRGHGRCSHAV